jgi:hypothetical protein
MTIDELRDKAERKFGKKYEDLNFASRKNDDLVFETVYEVCKSLVPRKTKDRLAVIAANPELAEFDYPVNDIIENGSWEVSISYLAAMVIYQDLEEYIYFITNIDK